MFSTQSRVQLATGTKAGMQTAVLRLDKDLRREKESDLPDQTENPFSFVSCFLQKWPTGCSKESLKQGKKLSTSLAIVCHKQLPVKSILLPIIQVPLMWELV